MVVVAVVVVVVVVVVVIVVVLLVVVVIVVVVVVVLSSSIVQTLRSFIFSSCHRLCYLCRLHLQKSSSYMTESPFEKRRENPSLKNV